MKSRAQAKHKPAEPMRGAGGDERGRRTTRALRRKALQDRESFRQVDEFLHGSGARA